MKFTNTQALALPIPTGRQTYHYDSEVPAFGVRVSPGGTRSWIVQYRHPFTRKRVRHTLGRCNVLAANEARKSAKQIIARVNLNEDPFPTPTMTLEQAYVWFALNHLAGKSEAYLKLAHTVWKLHTPKRLKRLPVEHISRAEWLAVPDRLIAEGKNSMSRFSHAMFRAMLNKLEEYELIKVNTLARISPKAVVKPRERVLSLDELALIWRAADRLSEEQQMITQSLIITGCRAHEIIGLRQREVDLELGVLTISADRVKTRNTHKVTLPPRLKRKRLKTSSPAKLMKVVYLTRIMFQ